MTCYPRIAAAGGTITVPSHWVVGRPGSILFAWSKWLPQNKYRHVTPALMYFLTAVFILKVNPLPDSSKLPQQRSFYCVSSLFTLAQILLSQHKCVSDLHMDAWSKVPDFLCFCLCCSHSRPPCITAPEWAMQMSCWRC